MENNLTNPAPETANFVDTSTPAFGSQFKPGNDDFYGGNSYQDDFYDNENTDEELNNDNQNDDWQNLNDDQNNDSTGNDVLDTFIDWANNQGLDISELEIDPNDFNQEDMDYLVGKHYSQKYFKNVDPNIVELAENGINIDEYVTHRQQIMGFVNTDPIQLYKASMYDFIKNAEVKLGTIELNEQGIPTTEEGMKYLIQEVERRTQNMSQEELTQRGMTIQEHYRQQLNSLPQQMVEQQRNQYMQQLQSYNKEVDELLNVFTDKLSKTDNLIIDFSGQAEKEDYLSFMKQYLTIHEYEGEQVVPLLHRLQNDADFLAQTMRLLHMHEKGYFTDLKNKERNAAFKNLSISPVLNKNTKISKKGGAGRYADTSDPSYQKQFKR